MSIDAMKQALEVIEAAIESGDWQIDGACDPSMAIHSLYEAIAEAEKQEPVAWMTINEYGEEDDIHYENPEGHLLEGWTYKPLYTHPPLKEKNA
jgi:predicted lipid-binding transport protein (Tim44 family)